MISFSQYKNHRTKKQIKRMFFVNFVEVIKQSGSAKTREKDFVASVMINCTSVQNVTNT